MQRKVQIQIILYQPITFEKVGGEWQFEIDQTKKNIEYRLNFLNEENTYLSSQVELLRKEMAGEVKVSSKIKYNWRPLSVKVKFELIL